MGRNRRPPRRQLTGLAAGRCRVARPALNISEPANRAARMAPEALELPVRLGGIEVVVDPPG